MKQLIALSQKNKQNQNLLETQIKAFFHDSPLIIPVTLNKKKMQL